MPDESLSPEVFSRLREILGTAYHVSRDAAIYAEVVTGGLNYRGMGELRDALEHIQRVINANDEEEALGDITEAYEHLRRCGVESIQHAASEIYLDTIKLVKTPPLTLRLLFLEVPDKGRVRKLRMNAMEKIAAGRSHKADKDIWMDSIAEFKSAIESCFELQDMYPHKAEVRLRQFNIACGIITVLSLIFAFAK